MEQIYNKFNKIKSRGKYIQGKRIVAIIIIHDNSRHYN